MGDALNLFSVGDTAAVLAPCGLLGVDLAKRRLKGEMTHAGVIYAELAKRLTDMGLPETEASVQVKINRGAFPAWFMLAATKALGVRSMRLHDGD